MILYQNKHGKSGDNNFIQKRMTFSLENSKVRNFVVTYKNKFNYCEIQASEASGENMILLHK